jgi:hypothetical protein
MLGAWVYVRVLLCKTKDQEKYNTFIFRPNVYNEKIGANILFAKQSDIVDIMLFSYIQVKYRDMKHPIRVSKE